AAPAAGHVPRHFRESAKLDAGNLRLAAAAIEGQALESGVLRHPIGNDSPAVIIFKSDLALIHAAIRRHPTRRPADTRSVMGRVPYNLSHLRRHRPAHSGVRRTRALRRFRHSVAVGGSAGVGMNRKFRGARVAPYQRPDGVYVDPHLPALGAHATVGEVALRTALRQLGQPYVWGGAGPSTYDCSGLVRRAYGRAGVRLTHFSGSQWNQGRLIPARDALPGDLILFGNPIYHVAIYLGAGWMLNAPFTGHYVDVLPVWRHPAGVVRP
ncbi:MAG: C40 family peptidase, partial [Frankiaceae bacterium]|nr:C40 family peptidase [Frankiaceae bacterium]